MEIWRRQQFLSPRREPRFLGACLALRAVTVAARVVSVAQDSAVIATLDMPAQRLGAAGDDSPPRLVLNGGQSMRLKIGLTLLAQNIGQAHTVGHDGG